MNKQKLIFSSTISSIITIFFVVIVVIWAEEAAGLKDWLKNLSGHHWTTKSIFSVAVYALFTALFYVMPFKPQVDHLKKALTFALVTTLCGVIILAGYFTWHFLTQ
ncbi:MAG: hypothetical protein WC813_04070 [Patescibacteria group bacterium]|jgi:hypothetical protein